MPKRGSLCTEDWSRRHVDVRGSFMLRLPYLLCGEISAANSLVDQLSSYLASEKDAVFWKAGRNVYAGLDCFLIWPRH